MFSELDQAGARLVFLSWSPEREESQTAVDTTRAPARRNQREGMTMAKSVLKFRLIIGQVLFHPDGEFFFTRMIGIDPGHQVLLPERLFPGEVPDGAEFWQHGNKHCQELLGIALLVAAGVDAVKAVELSELAGVDIVSKLTDVWGIKGKDLRDWAAAPIFPCRMLRDWPDEKRARFGLQLQRKWGQQ